MHRRVEGAHNILGDGRDRSGTEPGAGNPHSVPRFSGVDAGVLLRRGDLCHRGLFVRLLRAGAEICARALAVQRRLVGRHQAHDRSAFDPQHPPAPRPRGGPQPRADLFRVRAALYRHVHHHTRLRHSRAANGLEVLVRLLLSLVLVDPRYRGHGLRHRTALHDVSQEVAGAAEARLPSPRSRSLGPGLRARLVSPRGLAVSVGARPSRHHGVSSGSGAARVAAERSDGLGLSLVVACRRYRGVWLQGYRPDFGRSGRVAHRLVVVPRTAGADLHRRDSLHQGQAHRHGDGIACAPGCKARGAPTRCGFDGEEGGRRQHHRLHLEAASQFRCVHEVRALP